MIGGGLLSTASPTCLQVQDETNSRGETLGRDNANISKKGGKTKQPHRREDEKP